MLIKCKDVARLSSDYLDKSLPFWQRVKIKLHLLMCGHCSTFMKQLKFTVDVSADIEKQNLQDQPLNSEKILKEIKRRETSKELS